LDSKIWKKKFHVHTRTHHVTDFNAIPPSNPDTEVKVGLQVMGQSHMGH